MATAKRRGRYERKKPGPTAAVLATHRRRLKDLASSYARMALGDAERPEAERFTLERVAEQLAAVELAIERLSELCAGGSASGDDHRALASSSREARCLRQDLGLAPQSLAELERQRHLRDDDL